MEFEKSISIPETDKTFMAFFVKFPTLSDRLLIAAQPDLIKEQGETESMKCPNQQSVRGF
jgi:hypothetical protein